MWNPWNMKSFKINFQSEQLYRRLIYGYIYEEQGPDTTGNSIGEVSLHNGSSYTGEMTSLYWISSQEPLLVTWFNCNPSMDK